uniref:Fibrinogen C-terminal domain-containing protein n=1 Tax=Ceratitis capitata TaxID=7213 RepID=W8BHY4_CERCA
MQPIPVDKVLMALSILLATPENYIQLNSKGVDLSSLQRGDFDKNVLAHCRASEMGNLTDDMDRVMNNQMLIKNRINSTQLKLSAFKTHLSNTNSIGCSKQQFGEVLMKVPQILATFSVWCVSNKFGNNWLLVAKRNFNGKLFLKKSTESEENSIGHFSGEYFIGFEKLRAITDSQLCELLIVETETSSKQQWYDYYQYVAFGGNNKVKLLGEHKSNRLNKPLGLLAHALAVNEKLKLTLNTDVTIYLRRAELGVVSQLTGI